MRRHLLIIPALAAMPAMAAFPSPVKSVKLDYEQKEAIVRFESDSPIRKAKPLCECTKVSVSGRILIARVDVSGFAKDTTKYIEATTDDGITTKLRMDFGVPRALSFNTPSLIWKVGAPPTPQELVIRIHGVVREVKEAAISGDDFDFSPRTIREGREYAVSVTPRSTAKKTLNRLVIKTGHPDARYAQYIIYLSVQP